MEEHSPVNLTDCNYQLSIKCIYDTQITLGVLQLASPNEGEGLVGSLTEGRNGCAHAVVIQCSSDVN